MKRFIPVAAAVAIVVVAAVAILASGEVLSFSAPGSDVSVDDRAPADQAQPQDYEGSGSQLYYFGPDFMCLIYTDTTIDCFGSNTHGVVSGVPSGTGFTHIDGGETYSCAFHQATRFNYCWGSITLRPSTIQPTATPEPTSTPEATATALPPGVTPEPTATSAPQATATPEPNPCRINLPTAFALPTSLTGSWISECVYQGEELENVADGDRYYRWTSFDVTGGTGSWAATLTSDQDTVLVLFEWNTETDNWDFVEQNDDLAQGNTNSRIEWTPVLGTTYGFVMTTYTANTLGDFTLTLADGTANTQSSTGEQSIGQSAHQGAMPFERRQ